MILFHLTTMNSIILTLLNEQIASTKKIITISFLLFYSAIMFYIHEKKFAIVIFLIVCLILLQKTWRLSYLQYKIFTSSRNYVIKDISILFILYDESDQI